jgi:hypothetical protein
VALVAKSTGHRHHGRGQAGEVGGDHRGRGHRVLLVDRLVAEDARRHDHQVHVAEPVEDLVGQGLVVLHVGGVEGHGLDHLGPGRPGRLGGLRQAWPFPPGQDHCPAPGRDQSGHDGLGDLGGASEYED